MPYEPTVWRDGETPLSAQNLNKIETQYQQAVADTEIKGEEITAYFGANFLPNQAVKIVQDTALRVDAAAPFGAASPNSAVIDTSEIYMVVGRTGSSSPYLKFLKWDDATKRFEALPDAATMPTGNVYYLCCDSAMNYLAFVHNAVNGNIWIYKRQETSFSKLSELSQSGDKYGLAFDPAGAYLALTYKSSPYVAIWKRTGDTFTKLASPGITVSNAQDLAYDPSGTYLIVTAFASPYIAIYKQEGDTFTKLADPAILPSDSTSLPVFDPTGTYLALRVSFYSVWLYKRTGNIFAKLAQIDFGSSPAVSKILFDPTGNYMVISRGPNLLFYKRNGDSFEELQLDQPSTMPTSGTMTGAAWGNKFLATLRPDYFWAHFSETGRIALPGTMNLAENNLQTAGSVGLGVCKAGGQAGEYKPVKLLWDIDYQGE
jgi:WD40 repeat protein